MRYFIFLILTLSLTEVFGNELYSRNPYFEFQWGLKNSGNPQNIDLDPITTYRVQGRKNVDIGLSDKEPSSRKKILVAVLDTGIDKSHPDLTHKIHKKDSECKALEKYIQCLETAETKVCQKTWFDVNNPEVDLDQNGYPMDCSGWSILGGVNAANILGSPIFSDEQGHGTHVSGIIGADPSNNLGIAGVSNWVEILPVQVLGVKPSEPIKPLSMDLSTNSVDISPTENGKEAYRKNLGDLVARGVIYAIRSGAHVINFSMGWPESSDSPYLRSIISEAQRRGIIIVAAAGNDSTRALLRPCAYPGVICVGSHGPDGSISHFSNYGSGVDLLAPGTNILSTYPTDKRSIRFRTELGYEYLHGTSQASPFVAGIIAEMLSRGIPHTEIYPRLMTSAEKLKEKLPLLRGAPHDLNEEQPGSNETSVEKRYVLGGLVNLKNALEASPKPWLSALSKERSTIIWDRKSSELKIDFLIKNHWQGFSLKDLKLRLKHFNAPEGVVRPQIESYQLKEQTEVWKQDEVKTLQVSLKITDSSHPGDSRIPSDLDLQLMMELNNSQRMIVLESEVVVPISEDYKPLAHEQVFEFSDLPMDRYSLVAFDENLDGQNRTDYLAIVPSPSRLSYYLYKNNSSFKYNMIGRLRVNSIENPDTVREQLLQRLPTESDQSYYVVGLLFDNSEKEEASVLKIHLLDQDFKVINKFSVDSSRVQLPSKVFWQKSRTGLMPVWVGRGFSPQKTPNLRDSWENPTGYERPGFRVYFIDVDNSLQAIEEFKDYQVMDILEPNLEQIKRGIVPVLLSKNRGNINKPSYLFDFAVAELSEGKLQNLKQLDQNLEERIYRNLIESRVDKILSLDFDKPGSQGTFWFGEGAGRTQRLSILLPDPKSEYFDYFDINLKALRGSVDAALWVRSVYYGRNQMGAFALTNSEIQYHDLVNDKVISKSLERYTFYSDMMFTNLHFPIVVKDQNAANQGLPALFTTESSGLSKGVKVKTIARDQRGQALEMVTPAKLRFKSDRGCKPLDNPSITEDGEPALDYFCGKKLLRLPLIY